MKKKSREKLYNPEKVNNFKELINRSVKLYPNHIAFKYKLNPKDTKVISVKYTLGNIKLFEKTYENSYKSYELIETETLLTSYFLPIKITKIIAVETTTNKILHNFDEEKDEIVSKSRDEAYASVPEGVTIDNEDLQISSIKSGKYVTIYLKSSVYLKYNK